MIKYQYKGPCHIMNFVRDSVDFMSIMEEFTWPEKTDTEHIFQATCVFDTPRHYMRISSLNKIFYCDKCASGGDIIIFFNKLHNKSPKEVIQYLVKQYNIDVPLDIEERELWLGS